MMVIDQIVKKSNGMQVDNGNMMFLYPKVFVDDLGAFYKIYDLLRTKVFAPLGLNVPGSVNISISLNYKQKEISKTVVEHKYGRPTPRIIFNTKIFDSNEDLIAAMAHEMIHIHHFYSGIKERGHGPLYISIAKVISDAIQTQFGFVIPPMFIINKN
ncbi:MAG: SprT-like domain-containing protein [Patescibacteria group bacterium]|nr:SprT-like domain-containing protein [Patescibacteria group bacterium]